jgi:Protein of unknown function (DUF560).
MRFYLLVGVISLMITPTLVFSSQSETDLRIEQRQRQQQKQSEDKALAEADLALPSTPSWHVPLETLDVNALGRALYQAIQQHAWDRVAEGLPYYQTLPGHDAMLILYAKGGLARQAGNLAQAVHFYQALLELKPDFLLAQLSLARVLFEDYQSREAKQYFEAIATSIAGMPHAAGVQRTVSAYLQALSLRQSWQGSLAIGPEYHTNINKTSHSETCLLSVATGCAYVRKTPDAIASYGWGATLSAAKTWAVSGHHHGFIRGMAYGVDYDKNDTYNQWDTQWLIGYRYQNAANQLSIGPLLEGTWQGGSWISHSFGVNLDYLRILTPASTFKGTVVSKDIRYQGAQLKALSGQETYLSATWFFQLHPNWLAFIGANYTDSQSEDTVFDWRSLGGRVGVSFQPTPELDGLFSYAYQDRNYREYNAMLGNKRHDIQHTLVLSLRLPTLTVAGFSPVITGQYHQTRSNVDWLYSHDYTRIQVQFEKQF